MIISHKHEYLFVELPHTASTAISRELREHYDGSAILRKHATYHEFLQVASPEERGFFVFSGIRNPVDETVTVFYRYRKERRRDRRHSERGVGWRRYSPIHVANRRRARFIADTGADFPAYFKRYYRLPYSNWSSLRHREFDYVIRYERLQEDFARVLELLGILQKRPLPWVNRTDGKDQDFWSYFGPDLRPRAKWVFGPFMEEWGYEFPPEWGSNTIHWLCRMEYRLLAFGKRPWWRYVRPWLR